MLTFGVTATGVRSRLIAHSKFERTSSGTRRSVSNSGVTSHFFRSNCSSATLRRVGITYFCRSVGGIFVAPCAADWQRRELLR